MSPEELHAISTGIHRHIQQQDYNFGWNDCLEHVIKVLKPHRMTTKSVGGFLGVCTCGEAIDDYQEHLLALIKGEQK